MRPSQLDPERIVRQTFVARVEHHAVLGSTNDRAKKCAADRPASLPLLIVADEQTAGRGRGSNRWWTGPGSLACSLLFDPEALGIEPGRRSMASLGAGLAVAETVAPLLAPHPVGLHWPNDVFAAGRKLAGILVETLPQGLQVIGIGLNTNNTIDDAPPELRPLVATLRDLTGSRHDPTTIVVGLLRHLERQLRRLASTPDEIGARADRLCLQHGQALTVECGGATLSGTCAGIAPDGAMILETPTGPQKVYSGVLRPTPSPSGRGPG